VSNLGFVSVQLRLEIVFFLLRFDQLCSGARNFRSRLAKPGVGSGHGCFAHLQLLSPRDPKLFRCILRNFGLSYLRAQSARPLSVKDAQNGRKRE
jgi:hypothetical protein